MDFEIMVFKIQSKIGNIFFILRNLISARKLPKIEAERVDEVIFRGYSKVDSNSISKIYSKLNDGSMFSNTNRWLYSRIGSRCLFVAEQISVTGASKIVGMNMYYFNKRDARDNTVHEGFIGVLPEIMGRGIATKLRQNAIFHFKSAGCVGISTRISLNNLASLASAKKTGFQPIEEYEDPSTGEKRYYMICKF